MQRYDEMYFKRLSEDWEGLSPFEFIGYLSPKCQQILTHEGLKSLLEEERTLKIKMGIDPTGHDVHLGHLVPIMLLRQFIRVGHHVDFIIGDFTARIGDPSGRESSRAPVTKEDIEKNYETYTEQISPFIDVSKLSIRRNSEWLDKTTLENLFGVLQSVSLTEAVQREDFRARFRNEQAVSLAEAMYGVLMGLDSVALETDIELGGIDQLLNFQQCRSVQAHYGMKEEAVLVTPILEGTAGDGRKMSKSFGNYIAVSASAGDKFGKIMSIPDSLIVSYFTSFADVHEREVGELTEFAKEHPLEAKKQLATFIVAFEAGNIEAGLVERESFERKFAKKEITTLDAVEVKAEEGTAVFEALFATEQFASKAELRRLFDQSAVRALSGESETVLTLETLVEDALGVVRVGKLKLFNLVLES